MKELALCFLIVTFFYASAYGSPIQWSANGHYYELISNVVSWDEARIESEARSYLGVQGHLVTITSLEENLWISNTFNDKLNSGWIGAHCYYASNIEPKRLFFAWVNREHWDFDNWVPNEPSFDGDTCKVGFSPMLNENGRMWWEADGHFYYLVEYDTIPEPSSVIFLIAGFPILILKRKLKASKL